MPWRADQLTLRSGRTPVIPRWMRRVLFLALLALAGCSTAPVADLLDATNPGRSTPSRSTSQPRDPGPPEELLPHPPPRRGDVPPTLPPVPAGNSPATRDAEESTARIQPPPGADGSKK